MMMPSFLSCIVSFASAAEEIDIFKLVAGGDQETIAKMINEHPSQINVLNETGMTPLHVSQ